ncbi:hypothetical protein [Tropicimonas marinistellae]|nr:hypothetical protein [Tropicimonas marinistellae]
MTENRHMGLLACMVDLLRPAGMATPENTFPGRLSLAFGVALEGII